MRRPLVVLLYVAIFTSEVVWASFSPLVPTFAARYHLSGFEAGVLLASASVAVVAWSVPAGALGIRFGARTVTLWGLALVVVADLAQAAASSYAQLALARTLFGACAATVWVVGAVWAGQEVPPPLEARALALVIPIAGLGATVGPGLAGYAAEHVGTRAPFAVMAVLTATLLAALLVLPTNARQPSAEHRSPRAVVRAARASPLVASGLVLCLAAGVLEGAFNLLVPLELSDAGRGPGAIGVVFSLAAAVFIVVSVLVARLDERSARMGIAAGATIAVAFMPLIAVANASPPALLAMLVLAAPIEAVMFTAAYPLGVVGARRAGVHVGAVSALLTIVVSSGALVGPLGAGALAEATSRRATFAVLSASMLVFGLWIARHRAAAAGARGAGLAGRPPFEAEASASCSGGAD